MQNSFLILTQSNSKILVSISIVFIILIFLYQLISLFLNKKQNLKINKIFNTKYIIWVCLIFGIILGFIFLAINKFKLFDFLNYNQIKQNNEIWVWESIEFLYAFGSWIVILILFSVWISLPFIIYKSVKNLIKEKSSFKFYLKRFFWLIIFIIITLLVSNLMWVLPINYSSTGLQIFKIDESFQSLFYIWAKWIGNNVILTNTYAWTFIGYTSICFIISFLLVLFPTKSKRINLKDIKSKQNRFEVAYKCAHYPLKISNSLASVELFCFVVCYFLFNVNLFFIHILTVVFLFFLIITLLFIFIFLFGIIKFKNNNQHTQYVFIVKKIVKNLFSLKQKQVNISLLMNNEIKNKYLHKKEIKSLNIVDSVIVPLLFTLFLGFSNLITYNNGVLAFDLKLKQPIFWITTIISTIIFHYISIGINEKNIYSKNFVGNGTFAVAPGLQTGTLSFLTPIFNKCNNFINEIFILTF